MKSEVIEQVKKVIAQAEYNRKNNRLAPDDADKINAMMAEIESKVSELEECRTMLYGCATAHEPVYS